MEAGNENVRVRMDGDRISSLPDEIIHLILSFNDTKYAVQTSVLSPRWKHIWKTLPYLNFSTGEFRILPKFSKFVNRVLSLRNNGTEVSGLDLYFRGPANQKFMQKIANYVVSHNVQKVNIFATRISAKKDHQLPVVLFSSQSIKHLRIKTSLDVYSIYPLPLSPWDCPALTSIELKDVWLGANAECDLFSKCVTLKNLTLSSCRSNELKLMKILCPQLVSLSISYCCALKYEILAPNLSYFYYDGSPRVLTTCGLNSLEKVNLYVDIFSYKPSVEEMHKKAHVFLNMLHQLRNAKIVTLYGCVIEFLSTVIDLLQHEPSPLCNLKCLNIEGLEKPKKNKRAKSHMARQVMNFLLNSSPTATVNIEYKKETFQETLKQARKETSQKEFLLTYNIIQTIEAIHNSPEYEEIIDAAVKKQLLLQIGIEDNTPPSTRSNEGSSSSNNAANNVDVQAFLKDPKFQDMIDRAVLRSMASYHKALQRHGLLGPSNTPHNQVPPSPYPPLPPPP